MGGISSDNLVRFSTNVDSNNNWKSTNDNTRNNVCSGSIGSRKRLHIGGDQHRSLRGDNVAIEATDE